jgi:hypothetical protein
MGVVTFVLAELYRKIPKINSKKANFIKILLHLKKILQKNLPDRSYERNKKMGFPVCSDLSLHFHKKGQNH